MVSYRTSIGLISAGIQNVPCAEKRSCVHLPACTGLS